MKFRTEINKKNEIRVWDTENPNELNAPFFYQPNWPDGTEWSDKEEAEAWLDLFVNSMEDPQSKYLPGRSPNEPKRLRPEPVDIETGLPIGEIRENQQIQLSEEQKQAKLESAKAKLTALGLDEAEVQAILGL